MYGVLCLATASGFVLLNSCWNRDTKFSFKFNKDIDNFIRFYNVTSPDGKRSIEKWTSPSVHDLKTIYQHLEIANVLDATRQMNMKAIDKFKVNELKYYCKRHHLKVGGKKVCMSCLHVGTLHSFPLTRSTSYSCDCY